MRNGEDHMKIIAGQQIGLPVIEPFFFHHGLAFRAVSVPAAMMGKQLGRVGLQIWQGSPFGRRHAEPAFKRPGKRAKFGIAQHVGQLTAGMIGVPKLLTGNGYSGLVHQLPK